MDNPTPEPTLPMPQSGGAWVRLPDGRLVREGEQPPTEDTPADDQPGEAP